MFNFFIFVGVFILFGIVLFSKIIIIIIIERIIISENYKLFFFVVKKLFMDDLWYGLFIKKVIMDEFRYIIVLFL